MSCSGSSRSNLIFFLNMESSKRRGVILPDIGVDSGGIVRNIAREFVAPELSDKGSDIHWLEVFEALCSRARLESFKVVFKNFYAEV